MAESYQLMESAVSPGYSVELIDGEDPLIANPAGNRIRWPGAVMSVPSLTEDYNHQDIQPLGSGPDPLTVVKKNETFEVEIESLISEDFIGVDELISKSLGVVDAGTGVVTFERPIPSLTIEWGIRNKGTQSHVVKILTATNGITYTITIDGVDADVLASSDTPASLASALQIIVDGFTGVSAVVQNTDEVLITADVAGTPFNIVVSTDSVAPTLDIDIIEGQNTSWFHLLEGAKINTVTLTLRPDDKNLLRIAIIGRKHTGSLVPVATTGDGIEDLVVQNEPPSVHKHITYTFLRKNGTVINKLVKEFDLTWTNNLERIFGDNQAYFAECLIEGKRRFTFSVTTQKMDDALLDISRALPSGDTGRLSVQVVIDQTEGGDCE